jgi:Rrf2 family protein
MIKINKKVEYALIVLKHMHNSSKGQSITAREVCDQFGAPFDTTSKVMQIMNKAKILSSHQGIKGGYELSTDLTKVNYLQLVELIEGRKASKDCVELNCTLLGSCNIIGPIKKLNEYLLYYFKSITLAELFTDDSLLLDAGLKMDSLEKGTLRI